MRLNYLLAGVFLLGGCMGAKRFESPSYVPSSQAYGKLLPLRVAIAYPEEGIGAPNRDEDIGPVWNSSCAQGHTYISPRLDISRGLLDELRAAGAFKVLHWAPESLDDYDLIVRLKIVSAGKRFESDICPMILGPTQWELVVTDQRGNELERRKLTMAKVHLLARSVVARYRKDQQKFLGEAVRPILAAAESVAGGADDIDGARSIAYVDKRDPELKRMREQLAQESRQEPRLAHDYLLRLGALESARIIEGKTTEAHQRLNDEAWAKIQEQSRRELKEYGENVNRMLAEQFALLLDGIVNAGLKAGSIRGLMPPELQRAAALAHGDLARRVETPSGAQDMIGALSEKLLPGKSARLVNDAAFGIELAQSLKGVLDATSRASAASAAGCGKDDDCKGDRICVNSECADPPARKSSE